MSTKPETLLVNNIMDRLEAEGGWWFKVHGSPMQKAGIPDIIGCWEGRFIGIEVKVGDNTPSLLQKEILKCLVRAGAMAGVAYSIQEALDVRGGRKQWL